MKRQNYNLQFPLWKLLLIPLLVFYTWIPFLHVSGFEHDHHFSNWTDFCDFSNSEKIVTYSDHHGEEKSHDPATCPICREFASVSSFIMASEGETILPTQPVPYFPPGFDYPFFFQLYRAPGFARGPPLLSLT